MLCVRFRMFTQSQSITGGEKRARLTLLARQCVKSLIRSRIVKTFGSQASEFEANHRYSTDAIVCKAVADTRPSGVDSNETRYSYIPVVNHIGLGTLYLKKCVMPRLVPRIASQQFLYTSVQHALDI